MLLYEFHTIAAFQSFGVMMTQNFFFTQPILLFIKSVLAIDTL
jgi:hypothetical protein